MNLREYSTIDEASEFLDVSVEQLIEWQETYGGPKVTTTANPRVYLRRDLHVFKRELSGQSGL